MTHRRLTRQCAPADVGRGRHAPAAERGGTMTQQDMRIYIAVGTASVILIVILIVLLF